jgi:hypothetical protein
MNRSHLIAVASGLVFVLATPAPAQSLKSADDPMATITANGSVRIRYEALDGQFRPGFAPEDDLWSLRSTLFLEWNPGPFRIAGEVYDSRAYGSGPGGVLTTGEVNTLEPVQLYLAADLDAPLGDRSKLTLQAGRFTLNLGSRRLVAADDYRNTTNGYTGLRADLRLADRTSATVFYTLPQQRRPGAREDLEDNRFELDREDGSQRLYGGYLSRPLPAGGGLAEVGYIRFRESDRSGRPTRNRDLHSLSARLITEPRAGRFDYEAELIRQTGSIREGLQADAPRLEVEAWFVHADAGYTFQHPWRTRLSVEFDRATGESPGGRYSRFDTLFGMRRADLAPAGIYAALGRTNLETLGVRIEAVPSGRLDVFVSGRALWAASATDSFSTTGVRDPTGGAGRFAGYQVEGRARYWIIPDSLRAELNAAVLRRDGLLAGAPNANPYGNTRYVSLALTRSF